jgi:hypothetical protein
MGCIVVQEQCTFCFNLEDEEGQIHTIILPGSLYIVNFVNFCVLNTGENLMMIMVLTSKVLQQDVG